MNKLAILLLLAFSFGANAQTQLRVRLADNSQIHVSVNGRYFNKRGTSVTVGDLPQGKHFLKIYTVRYDRWGRSYERIVYQGTVRTNNGMATNFTYDPYTRRMDIQDQDINDNTPYNPNPDNNQYRAYYDNGGGKNKNKNYNNDNSTTTPPDDKYTRPASPVASPVSADELGTFTEKESAILKEKVAAKNTDTEKLKLLKDELKKEQLSTLQVSYIMDWFLFESTKLEFAKWAYAATVDQENYSSISNKFAYKSSQEELTDFINKQ